LAKFTLTIETDQEYFPENRLEQSREQYRLRDVLVLVTSAVINRSLTAGNITAITGVHAEYSYIARRQKTATKPAA
jgi:hypothetical protein